MNSQLTVENLTANVFKGRVQLQGTVGLAGTTPAFDLNGLAERIDLGAAVPGGTVAGTFHGKFHLKGTAAKPEIALDSRIDKLDSGQFGVKEVALNVSGGSEKMNVEIKGLTKRGAPFGGGASAAGAVRRALRPRDRPGADPGDGPAGRRRTPHPSGGAGALGALPRA